MPRVHVLDKELSELIAAGEVIERPCSVIKELVENSIDSGATAITAEIKQGGITYIRITDNGCGIPFEDVPTAFLRHATSKLSGKDDLNKIMTLGFRGEALASISAVARCEIITKPAGEEYGAHYIIEGTEEKLYERTGCPDGTTIVIRDIFYNVPARLKFLKQDKYEGSAVASLISRIAVSHPEISFRFIRNNSQELFTPGDSRLYSAVYSVFGREFAASMIPVSYSLGKISVTGYTVKPLWGRKNRSMQHFFVNGRYIRSFTCMSALEEAYRNSIMEGKFPACALFLEVPPDIVDVNVHPAKTEVRFADDKLVYDALYFAVKNAILSDAKPAEMEPYRRQRTEADYRLPPFSDPPAPVQTRLEDSSRSPYSGRAPASVSEQDQSLKNAEIREIKQGADYEHEPFMKEPSRDIKPPVPAEISRTEPEDISEHLQSGYGGSADKEAIDNLSVKQEREQEQSAEREFRYIGRDSFEKRSERQETQQSPPPAEEMRREDIYFRLIGEAFRNYAIAETEDGLLIVDKHAAHERIRFERLKDGREQLTAQLLLEPEELALDYNEYDALVRNLSVCAEHGFEIEPLKAPKVLVKGIPTVLEKCSAGDIVTELAQNFAAHRHDPLPEILDDMYHTIACHGAIRGGEETREGELADLISQVLADERIRYCPHGRPVMFKLTRKELEKQFRRII